MDVVNCGVRCDNCDWTKKVSFDEIDSYLHYKCPECGTEVLDENEYNFIKKLKNIQKNPFFQAIEGIGKNKYLYHIDTRR